MKQEYYPSQKQNPALPIGYPGISREGYGTALGALSGFRQVNIAARQAPNRDAEPPCITAMICPQVLNRYYGASRCSYGEAQGVPVHNFDRPGRTERGLRHHSRRGRRRRSIARAAMQRHDLAVVVDSHGDSDG